MEQQRRKRGIEQVKGRVIKCSRCGVDVTLNRNKRTLFCRPCYEENSREHARRASVAKASTEAGRQYARDWSRHKRQISAAFRVACHMKVLMHRGLNGQKQGRSWRSFVPYTLEELMARLERQFLPGMTWENKGRWHIDHIRPLSSFTFASPDDPQFREAWALSNLRPLWGFDNIRKHARRTHLL